MEEEKPDFRDYCEECGEKTRKRYVKKKGDYMVYECSRCGNNEEISREEFEDMMEEE